MSRTETDIPSNRRSPPTAQRRARGFTLLELLFACGVAALLLAIAVPGYDRFIERQRVTECVRELVTLAMRIEQYRTTHGFSPPLSLAELGEDVPLTDPWGNEYRYLYFESDEPSVVGEIRKDHNLHPLNTEFDLYSVGRDGRSRPPLTAQESEDDVIWARDGGFVGLARDY